MAASERWATLSRPWATVAGGGMDDDGPSTAVVEDAGPARPCPDLAVPWLIPTLPRWRHGSNGVGGWTAGRQLVAGLSGGGGGGDDWWWWRRRWDHPDPRHPRRI
ncbi:hypothetical protein OsI_07908 [Oryza sativa Indica Group]|uniref:Uncharacterized protein n=1 Tax=Oryza sativa subsp. indica TaxID=39946 RepID=B8AES0_ORYSI|nr:hypothetical protein OsI_07908 [Oryza sativa Indica Group]